MGTVSAASLAAFFLKRRDSVALGIYGDGLAYLPPDTGDKQYFKILSSLAGVKPEEACLSKQLPIHSVVDSAVEALCSSFPHVRVTVPFQQPFVTSLDVATK